MTCSCSNCFGDGWVLSCNECGEDEVQRCDECAIFETDAEAQEYNQGVNHESY